jgi:hypothetical protein
MPFSLPDSHVDFFTKHQILEIEDLLTLEDADTLCQILEVLLKKKLGQKTLQNTSNALLWKAGRNLEKQDPNILKILSPLQLGKIANSLFKKRPIRIAYTQTLWTEDLKDSLFSSSDTLQNISSVSPLLGAIVLCLKSTDPEDSALPSLSHLKQGNVFFFSEPYPLDLPKILSKSGIRAFLIALSPGNAMYTIEPKDPHTHELKKSGYGFGDTLPEEVCSYLYR